MREVKRRPPKRHDLLGAHRLLRALEDIEFLQAQLRDADTGLRAVLTIHPLGHAFAQFQAAGGVTASDWETWLAGKPLPRRCRRSKRHLRLLSSNKAEPPVASRHGGDHAA